MTDDELLDLIRSTPWIERLLTSCEFELGRAVDGPVEPLHLAGGEPLETIAGDGSGGAYLLAGDPGGPRAVIFADSEGQGGKIADDLRTALALVVGVPFHVDAATRYRLDDGGVRLRAYLEQVRAEELENWPSADDDRARLRAALDLPALDEGMIAALHAADADERYRPISDAGDRYEPLLPG